MRLTCPNCGARYEVDDGMIPSEGRDVQCSNCSTTWFQPGRRVAEPAADAAQTAPETQGTDYAPPPSATPQRREIDPEVRDVLREEAERERQLRRAAAEVVETQEEMSLPEGDAGLRSTRDAVAEAAEDNFDNQAALAAGGGVARRDLLPDIDEINSTLRHTGDRTADEEAASDIETVDTAPRRRRGFRLGFGLMMMIGAGMIAAYTNAPQISERVPALAPVMETYVTRADSARIWLDTTVQDVIARIQPTEDAPTEDAPGEDGTDDATD